VGLVFVAFGANYTNLVIYLLLGNKWGETAAPSVLSWYCFYVLMMGINGITEGDHIVAPSGVASIWLLLMTFLVRPIAAYCLAAFLYATGNKEQMEQLNRYLVAFAALFAALSYTLITVRARCRARRLVYFRCH